jgi:signal transduction histidine kinase
VRLDSFSGRHLALAPVAFAVTEGPAHTVIYGNAIFRLLQLNGDIHIGSSVNRQLASDLTPVLDRVFKSGLTERDTVLDSGAQGHPTWSCTVWPVTGSGSMLEKLVVEVRDIAPSDKARAEQRTLAGRLLLGALREQDVARSAVRASDQANYLARVSRELSGSIDDGATRDAIRHVTLPRAGTWSIVDVVETDGAITRLPVVHPDPAKQLLARTLAPVAGEAAALMLASHDEANLAILREIGFGALLVVPLIVRARLQGTITFVSRAGDEPYTPEEIALAMDVGSRCAMALDNASMYREADALRRAAQAANISKSQFLSRMSHELRTPLNAIGGFAELMDMGIQGPVTEVQHLGLIRIMANQQHLLSLISDILNFASIEAGRVEYRWSEVPLEPLIGEVSAMLSGSIVAKNLVFQGPDPDAGVVAWADPDRVKQILINLLMNAVKYMGVNGGTITVTSGVVGELAVALVEDSGPGIPAEKLESIFEPFVQLTSGRTERQGGIGLGLAISRDLARAMGGDLTVESTVGVGSAFTLSLPRSPRPDTGYDTDDV